MAVVLSLWTLGMAGCVDGNATLDVAKDGSGMLEVRVSTPRDAAARLQTVGALLDALGVEGGGLLRAFQPPSDDGGIDRRALEAFARDLGPRVRLAAVSSSTNALRTGFSARYAFPDVRGVRWAIPPPAAGQPSGGGLAFDFVPGATALLKVIPVAPPARTAGDALPSAPESKLLSAALARLFDGLRLTAEVRVRGEVVRTNAERRTGSGMALISLSSATMNGGDLWTLVSLRSMTDAAAFRRRRPAGVFLQDPEQPLVILFR